MIYLVIQYTEDLFPMAQCYMFQNNTDNVLRKVLPAYSYFFIRRLDFF